MARYDKRFEKWNKTWMGKQYKPPRIMFPKEFGGSKQWKEN